MSVLNLFGGRLRVTASYFEFPGPLRGRPRMRENRVRSLAEVGVSWRSEPVFEFDPGSRWWGCALLP